MMPRRFVALSLALLAGTRAALLHATDTPPTVEPGRSIGLVLTGGGAFGSWETGALKALFEWWRKQYGEDPPIRIVAGTSTGALIAPFALLGRPAGGPDYIDAVQRLYTSFKKGNLVALDPKLLVPAAIFLVAPDSTPSTYVAGYPSTISGKLLWQQLASRVSDTMLRDIGKAWDAGKRVGASSIDFSTGRPWTVTNSPSDMGANGSYLRLGIMASAMAPLVLPPVPVCQAPSPCPEDLRKDPFFDGGIYEEAPFGLLFQLAAMEPPIDLTDVIVISAFPWFPGCDDRTIQKRQFPRVPGFGDVGNRMSALMSEASATKATQLAFLAIQLRSLGASAQQVFDVTGYQISGTPRLSGLFPFVRQGWEAFEFDKGPDGRMARMQKRGFEEGMAQLMRRDPGTACSTPSPIPAPH